MRNPVACVPCRSAKQRCLNNQDGQPCERCRATNRAEHCSYPPPGTSSIHRQPKRPRVSEHVEGTRALNSNAETAAPANNATQAPIRRHDAGVPSGISGDSAPSPKTAALLDGLDPFDLLTDEVKNSYLRCAYKWSFHHTPTLLLRIRDRTLEPWLAWAMLALAIRFVQDPPPPFRTQTEASNAYAAHARQILQPDLETPSISRVQALLMLTGHDWGAGNGRRAWIYLGMAIRLVEVMDLTQELKVPRNRMPTRDEFIEAEVRRRTAWTCFLMDSLLSGGKGRKRSLTAADMKIQLPCERESFVFGEPTCTEQLDSSVRMPPVSLPVGEIGLIGYSMRAANIWGKVARWACSDDSKRELPWASASQFQQLTNELARWNTSLPQRLQYDLFSLHSHNAVEQGQAYCYLHCIHLMSYMFLHRAYLPVLGPQQHGHGADETLFLYEENRDMWKSWQKTEREKLFNESTTVLEMLEEMRTFGVYFLRGLVPWIGFTIYTAVGVMLYCFNFPSSDDDPRLREKARRCVLSGCAFLKEMKTQWPMAETWFETIKRMQAYYRSALGQAAPASPEERQALRRAMIDYGALQPSPVQKPSDSSKAVDNAVASSISPVPSNHEVPSPSRPSPSPPTRLQQKPFTAPPPVGYTSTSTTKILPSTHPTHSLISPPTTNLTPNAYTSTYWNPPVMDIAPLEADETFNLSSFDLSNAELEQMVSHATQDFWASFPGEVGVGF